MQKASPYFSYFTSNDSIRDSGSEQLYSTAGIFSKQPDKEAFVHKSDTEESLKPRLSLEPSLVDDESFEADLYKARNSPSENSGFGQRGIWSFLSRYGKERRDSRGPSLPGTQPLLQTRDTSVDYSHDISPDSSISKHTTTLGGEHLNEDGGTQAFDPEFNLYGPDIPYREVDNPPQLGDADEGPMAKTSLKFGTTLSLSPDIPTQRAIQPSVQIGKKIQGFLTQPNRGQLQTARTRQRRERPPEVFQNRVISTIPDGAIDLVLMDNEVKEPRALGGFPENLADSLTETFPNNSDHEPLVPMVESQQPLQEPSTLPDSSPNLRHPNHEVEQVNKVRVSSLALKQQTVRSAMPANQGDSSSQANREDLNSRAFAKGCDHSMPLSSSQMCSESRSDQPKLPPSQAQKNSGRNLEGVDPITKTQTSNSTNETQYAINLQASNSDKVSSQVIESAPVDSTNVDLTTINGTKETLVRKLSNLIDKARKNMVRVLQDKQIPRQDSSVASDTQELVQSQQVLTTSPSNEIAANSSSNSVRISLLSQNSNHSTFVPSRKPPPSRGDLTDDIRAFEIASNVKDTLQEQNTKPGEPIGSMEPSALERYVISDSQSPAESTLGGEAWEPPLMQAKSGSTSRDILQSKLVNVDQQNQNTGTPVSLDSSEVNTRIIDSSHATETAGSNKRPLSGTSRKTMHKSTYFDAQDTALMLSVLSKIKADVSLAKIAEIIFETMIQRKWPGFDQYCHLDDALEVITEKRVYTKLRALHVKHSPFSEIEDLANYEDDWYPAAESDILQKLHALRSNQPRHLPRRSQTHHGLQERLWYSAEENIMLKHWLVQGRTNKYILAQYEHLRLPNAIKQKMQSLRKRYSVRKVNSDGSVIYEPKYSVHSQAHFDENSDTFSKIGPIPEHQVEEFKSRVRGLRQLLSKLEGNIAVIGAVPSSRAKSRVAASPPQVHNHEDEDIAMFENEPSISALAATASISSNLSSISEDESQATESSDTNIFLSDRDAMDKKSDLGPSIGQCNASQSQCPEGTKAPNNEAGRSNESTANIRTSVNIEPPPDLLHEDEPPRLDVSLVTEADQQLNSTKHSRDESSPSTNLSDRDSVTNGSEKLSNKRRKFSLMFWRN